MSDNVLGDIRVLDISRNIAGGYCTRLLSGWGARVTKIQAPNSNLQSSNTLSIYLNHSKKIIDLNLERSTDKATFKQLVKDADVLIEDYPPGALQKLELDYAALERLNNRLVMTSITGFGQDGPYSGYKSSPIVSYAMGGQMYVNGQPDRAPLNAPIAIPDYIGGLYAFVGTMLALECAAQSGKGQHVDISIMECLAASHQYTLTWPAYSGSVLTRPGWPGLRTPLSIYACADGYVNLRLQNIDMAFLAYLMEMPQLADDPRFQTPDQRYQNRRDLESIVSSKLANMSKKEVFRLAGEWRQSSGYVAALADVLNDPQYAERGFWTEIEHPEAGKLKCPGAPVKMDNEWKAGKRE